MEIRPIKFEKGKLKIIDQTVLPYRLAYLELNSYEKVVEAIKKMQIRGAPLIGITAAFGLALATLKKNLKNKRDLEKEIIKAKKIIKDARPTAVNLVWGLNRIEKRFYEIYEKNSIEEIRNELFYEAERILNSDIENNKKIGENGLQIFNKKSNVLTHCNAGALATGGFGTALGVIKSAYKKGLIKKVYVDETRPLLQGARLTTWELMNEGIPCVLITDNTSGYLMKKGQVDLIIVGADRITSNGDVANKIGTYMLAVCAKENKIPFYVAAPLSTVDMALKDGEDIIIEERSEEEVFKIGKVEIAPKNTRCLNYAFDVTPAKYISGLITEVGLLRKPIKDKLKKYFQMD